MAFDPTTAKPATSQFDPSTARLEPGQFDPATAQREVAVVAPERGMAAKLGSAALHGAGAEASGFGKFLGLAASTPFMLADKAVGMITGKEQTSAQDFAFKHLVDPATAAQERFAPTPEEAASIPLSMAHGLGSMAVDLPLIAMTHGKVGVPEAVASGARMATMAENALSGMKAMAPVAAAHAVNQAGTAMSQGVDNPTAYASGALSGLSATLMGALPMSLQGGVIKRVLSGVASGAATGEMERQGQNAVLEKYPELHQALTAQSVATNAAMGGLLGGIMGPRPAKTQIAKAIADTDALLNPVAPEPVAPLQIEHTTNSPNADPRTQVVYPDGSVAHPGDVEAYLKTLPDDQARMAARTRLYGLRTMETGFPDQTITDVLAKAPTGEPAPFVETIPAKTQQHVGDMATLRDAGEVPTGDPGADAARAFALHNDPVAMQEAAAKKAAPVSPDLDSGHVPTAMELAMLDAQRAKDAADGKAGTRAGFDQAEQTSALTKESDLTAIQNITKGRELAEAAARGEVPAEAKTLPVPHNEFLDGLKEVTPVEQKLPPKLKQELAKAVLGKDTHDAQLEALAALRDSKKTSSVSYELLGKLHSKLTEGMEKPNETSPAEVAPIEALQAETQGAKPIADVAFTNEQLAGMSHAQLSAAHDAAQNHNRGVEDQFVRDNTSPEQAVEFGKKGARARDAWLEKTLTVEQDAELQAKYADESSIAAYRDIVGQSNDGSPKQMGASIAKLFKNAGSPDFINSPEYAGIKSALAEAVEKGWTPDEVLAGARTRIGTLYGADAAEMYPRMFKQSEASKSDVTIPPEPAPVLAVPAPESAAKTPQQIAKEARDAAKVLKEAKLQEQRDAMTVKTARGTVMEKFQAARDTLDATVMGFNARLRAGEKLTPAEQDRFDDAYAMRKTLADTVDPSRSPSSDAHLEALAGYAKDSASPEAWAKSASDRLGRIASDKHDPVLSEVIRNSPRLDSVLDHLAQNGSAPWVKDLAAKLRGIGTDTTIGSAEAIRGMPRGTVGSFDPKPNHIETLNGEVSEQTVLHESVHAATETALTEAMLIMTPRNQREAGIKNAFTELEKVRTDAKKRLGSSLEYGLTNAHEFMAELHSNPQFQKFLSTKGLWARAVDAVRKLLGLKVDATTPLEKAMSLQGEFFGKEKYEAAQRAKNEIHQFDESPAGAAEVTDNMLARAIKQADEDDRPSLWARANQYIDQRLLPNKTVQYMADRVRAIPQLAEFSKFLDKYEGAYKSRELAGVYASHPAAQFSEKVDTMLRGMPADKSRELSQGMQEIAVGSSIGGFDPTLNFEANLKLRPDLSPTSKGYVDDIYRKYTQMQRSNPEAAQAIVDGAKVSRKNYVLDASTIISNLLNSVTGNAIKLETELSRLPPTDASYERLQARVLSARSEANLAVTHAPGLDFMAKDLQALRNGNAVQHLDGASFTLDQRLNAVFSAAKTLPEGSTLKAQLGEIAGKYGNQISNPYYHAGRSGEFFVNVGFKNMDAATWEKLKGALAGTNKILGDFTNQEHAFFRVETADQAAGLRRKLEAAGLGKIDISQSASGKLADNLDNSNAGISTALRSVLSTLHDSIAETGMPPEQASAMRDVLTRKFLSMLPETSSRMATIKRMGVPGYDGDFLNSFAKRALGGTRDTSNIYSLRAYGESFNGMRTAVENLAHGPDVKLQEYAQSVRGEINTRYTDSMKPLDNGTVNLINSMGHTFYLAASPAFFIRTMAQPWHRGLPYLGGKFGFVSAAKELGFATNTARQIMSATIAKGWKEGGVHGVIDADMKFTGMGLSPRDEAFVQELHDRGVLNLGQARQLQTMAMSGTPRMQDATRMAAMTAQYAEMSNRLITGLTAFRLAEKKGGNTHANTEYAVKSIDYVMDNFDPNNTARSIGKHGFAGKVTPLMTAFMNYNLQTMQQIARTVHDGMFNVDKSPAGLLRSAEAKREFAGLMATTTLISGTMGLPFANAFAGVYNMLTKDDDKPSDIRQAYSNFLSDTLGVKAGEVAAHGLGVLAGVDTSSFGMQNVLPGSEFLASRRLMKDRLADTSQGLMGPALNAGMDIAQAMSKFSDGQYINGLESALPSGLKGYWKAGELATHGYTDAKGNPLGMEATPWDIAVQATGLRPAGKAVQADAANYMSTDQSLLDHRKQVITDQIFKAYKFGDSEDKTDALAAMKAFNEKNPMSAIKDIASVFRQHAVGEALGKASGTGVNMNIHQYLVNQSSLRFANQTGMGMQ